MSFSGIYDFADAYYHTIFQVFKRNHSARVNHVSSELDGSLRMILRNRDHLNIVIFPVINLCVIVIFIKLNRAF